MEPYMCKNKIVIFGGHHDFVKKISLMLPNVRILQYQKSPDLSLIKNADAIFLQNRAMCHSMFTNIIKEVRKSGKEKVLKYFSQSSARKCAEEVIKIDKKIG